jgi:flagellar hook-associated protein 2
VESKAMTTTVNVLSGGLDVATLVDNLIAIDSQPITRMQKQTSTMQSKISAFQSVNSKISSLLTSVNNILYGGSSAPLTTAYSFQDRLENSLFASSKVTSSDESVVAATATKGNASGNYSITVSDLAQAKSMASDNFADINTATVGTGTISLTVGSGAATIINIDSTNNTLDGVRKAINAANVGVTATIINDGQANPYRLLLTSTETGTANAFTVTTNLSGGQALGFTEKQAAHDAVFNVNGIDIIKSSNTISDVIDGVTLSLKAKSASPVTLSVDTDMDSIVNGISGIISAYNAVNTYISSQFAYNQTTATAGILSGDFTLRNIQTQLQSALINSSSNRFTSYGVLSQVGIGFNRDGSLSLDESKLRHALSSDFTGVAALLLGDGTPANGVTATDNRVTFIGKTGDTQDGNYAVEVTALAQQASVTGSQVISSLAEAENLTITSGSTTVPVSLAAQDSLQQVLDKINAAFASAGFSATALNDGNGKIKITTNAYGSGQTVSIVSDKENASGSTGFGTSLITGTGTDIVGSINGHLATGSGTTLTGAVGQSEAGLSLSITQSTTGSYGSVTVAPSDQGVAGSSILGNLQSILKGITDPLEGPIHNATDSLSSNIKMINDQISAYQLRLDKEREMLTAQYNQADEALKMLTVNQASLENQLASLSSLK